MASSDNGHNPLRWDCEKQGCFNKKKRPKIEFFCDCFPRRINFGDVDGLVELNGKGLLLEWKEGSEEIPLGQKIAHQKLTDTGKLTTLCVVGNPETMTCERYGMFFMGKFYPYKDGDMEVIKKVIRRWVKFAERAMK